MTQFIGIILLISCFAASSFARDVKVSVENDVKLRFDSTRKYEDSDSTTNDSGLNDSQMMLELYPKLNFDLGEGINIKSSWVFELLKSQAGSSDFQGEGMALDELYISFENYDAEFFLGKFNPAFAYLWDYELNGGLWTSDLAEIYKITGKIGLGGKIKMNLEEYGRHDISVATFYYDDSNLSDTLLTRRTISSNNIGVASDTGSLSSFTINIFAKELDFFEGAFYNASYRFLKNPAALGIEDEQGYSIALGIKKSMLNNLVIKPMIEYVQIDSFNSFNNDFNQEFGDEAYLPSNLESILLAVGVEYGGWSFHYMFSDKKYSKLLESGDIKIKDVGFSMNYTFENNVTIKAGSRKSEQDDIDMSKTITSLQVLYKYKF